MVKTMELLILFVARDRMIFSASAELVGWVEALNPPFKGNALSLSAIACAE